MYAVISCANEDFKVVVSDEVELDQSFCGTFSHCKELEAPDVSEEILRPQLERYLKNLKVHLVVSNAFVENERAHQTRLL